MRKFIFAVVLFFCPVFCAAQDNEEQKHVHLTAERLDAVMEMINNRESFQDVVNFLQQDKYQEAKTVLSARIEKLQKGFENKWTIYDGEPGILDCLYLRYMINIFTDDINGAQTDCDLMVKFSPETEVLRTRMPEFINIAKEKPEEFKAMLQKSVELIR